ncbi:hypothetical protein Tco_0889539 [Tanacetum coccineum]
MGDENPIRTLGDYSKASHKGYRNTIELPEGNNVVPLRSDTIWLVQNECLFHGLRKDRKTPQQYPDVPTTSWRISIRSMNSQTIDQSASGKLCDLNLEESWAILEDLALYDNESGNDPKGFAKPVKAITLPQDIPINKITASCEICSGPHNTQSCMENPEQDFVEYASSRTDEAGDARLSKFEADFKQQQSEMTNKIDTVLKAITDRIAGTLPSDTVKNPNWGAVQFCLLVLTQQQTHNAQHRSIAQSTQS